MLYYIVLYNIVPYCTVQCCTVLQCTVLYETFHGRVESFSSWPTWLRTLSSPSSSRRLYSNFSQESESLESWMPQLQSWIFCPPQAVPSDLTYLLKYITNLYVEDEVTVGGVNHSPSFQACHCGGHTNWILFYVIHICDVIIFSVFYSFIFAWNINIIEKRKKIL